MHIGAGQYAFFISVSVTLVHLFYYSFLEQFYHAVDMGKKMGRVGKGN